MNKHQHWSVSIRPFLVAATALTALVVATGVQAQQRPAERMPAERIAPEQRQNVRVGTLTCDLSPGIGLIIGSQRSMTCRFRPSRGPVEFYTGTVSRFGLDLGVTAGARMAWAVFAPSRDRRLRGALAGTYAGVSGEATAGLGLGANVLVGGSGDTIALQPLSVQAQAGINLALGVAAFTLTPGRAETRGRS